MGGRIATGASANDDDVVRGVVHEGHISRSGVRPSSLVTARDQGFRGNRYAGPVQTRYLIIAALVTALVILFGVGAWFLTL